MNYTILKRAEKFLVRSIQMQIVFNAHKRANSCLLGTAGLSSFTSRQHIPPLLDRIFVFIFTYLFLPDLAYPPQHFCLCAPKDKPFVSLSPGPWHTTMAYGLCQNLPMDTPALPIATGAFIFCCKKTRTPYRSIGCLLVLSVFFGVYLKLPVHLPFTIYTMQSGHITVFVCR